MRKTLAAIVLSLFSLVSDADAMNFFRERNGNRTAVPGDANFTAVLASYFVKKRNGEVDRASLVQTDKGIFFGVYRPSSYGQHDSLCFIEGFPEEVRMPQWITDADGVQQKLDVHFNSTNPMTVHYGADGRMRGMTEHPAQSVSYQPAAVQPVVQPQPQIVYVPQPAPSVSTTNNTKEIHHHHYVERKPDPVKDDTLVSKTFDEARLAYASGDFVRGLDSLLTVINLQEGSVDPKFFERFQSWYLETKGRGLISDSFREKCLPVFAHIVVSPESEKADVLRFYDFYFNLLQNSTDGSLDNHYFPQVFDLYIEKGSFVSQTRVRCPIGYKETLSVKYSFSRVGSDLFVDVSLVNGSSRSNERILMIKK